MPSVFSNWPLEGVRYGLCVGSGSTFTAPGRVIAVLYNGVLLRRGEAAPRLSYTAAAEAITLNFALEPGDRLYALCVGSLV